MLDHWIARLYLRTLALSNSSKSGKTCCILNDSRFRYFVSINLIFIALSPILLLIINILSLLLNFGSRFESFNSGFQS